MFGEPECNAAESLIALGFAEDLGDVGDLTCQALIDESLSAAVQVVVRKPGVLAGCPVAEMVFAKLDPAVRWEQHLTDGTALQPGDVIADVRGPLRSVLTGERTALNFLTHLSGVATLTRQFVEAVAGTNAGIYDTRKTHPGYRLLEKYAVRTGGGRNHRIGLYDGILIKDNHLAALGAGDERPAITATIQHARDFLVAKKFNVPVEVEVDTLEQLRDALHGKPQYILLDNMNPTMLREAVRLRDEVAPDVQLEASGGVNLETVRDIAETGVERISVGALTHSATHLDIAFDWANTR